MPPKFRPHHEIFCRELIRTGNGSEAYRRAFPGPLKPDCPGSAAARLRQKPYIRKRLKELQMRITRKSEITLEKILNDYQSALEMAANSNKPGDMISAAREQARLVGLLVERREVGSVGEFEAMENVEEVLEAVAKEAGDEAAMALAKAFGIIAQGQKEVIKNAPAQDAEALIEAVPGSDAVN